MTDRLLLVHVDLNGRPHLAGRLWARLRGGKESATFQYDQAWLANPFKFALEPALSLGDVAHHTAGGRAIFGAIGDSAPDRWGRVLIRRHERLRAKEEERAVRTLGEADFLLGVSDHSRQGALRFSETDEGPFLAQGDGNKVPPLVTLPRLLAAASRFDDDDEDDEDLKLLLAPGSSLGGARPKASVLDRDGRLSIAKFPHKNDTIKVTAWEAVALSLAAAAGITTTQWRLEAIDKQGVLIVRRFDRDHAHRVPFLSAMSMLGAGDGDGHEHSYIEIADALRQYGAKPIEDCKELWRRIVFNVLISNTDDHLRNHGFLYEAGRGWRLSPAYDLNPVPIDWKARMLSIAIDEHDRTASVDIALGVAKQFGLKTDEAKAIARDVAAAVGTWRNVADAQGMSASEINRMASAFEHDDLNKLLAR